MPNNEDYLDSLLAQAQQEIASDSAISLVSEMTRQAEAEEALKAAISELPEINTDNNETAEDVVSSNVDAIFTEASFDSANIEDKDPNAMLSPDDIAALFASAESKEEPAEEPAVEEPAEESVVEEPAEEPGVEEATPVIENKDPNAMLSADEIAALFASAETTSEPADEPIVEEVVDESIMEEPAPVIENKDLNAMLSADEIAALFASAESKEELAEEPAVEEPAEEPVVEEATPVIENKDPNAMLSADEIAALFASAESKEEPAEEPAPEDTADEPIVEESAPAVEDKDPNAMLSADEIAALFANAEATDKVDEQNTVDKNNDNLSNDEIAAMFADAGLDFADRPEESDSKELSLQDLLDAEAKKSSDADLEDGLNSLGQDEINDLLNSNSETNAPKEEMEIDINDLDALESLGIFDKDSELNVQEADLEELREIDSMIDAANSTEEIAVDPDDDILTLLNKESRRQAIEEAEAQLGSENDEPNSEEDSKSKKKKRFGKKNKDKNAPEDELIIEGLNDKPQKESVISKFISFLTASEDDDNANSEAASDEEGASGENKAILDELDSIEDEKGKQKGKQKDKKKKDKKGKKGKDSGSSDDETDDEGGESKDKKKPKKEKKVKEKKPEEPDNSKPLNKKNVRKIGILAALLLALILLLVFLVPNMLTAQRARNAYYKQDYETAYKDLFGQKLNESDQLIFDRSKTILKMDHKLMAFRAYNKMDMKEEALDQLLQAVDNYEPWLIDAETYGCVEAFNNSYNEVVTALDVTYGLSVEAAKEVIMLPTDLEYSLMVYSIVNHTEYIDPNAPFPEPFIPETEKEYPDMLPEEGM